MEELRKAPIVGVYLTQQGNLPGKTSAQLYVEAVKGALKDAGLSIKDVDGVAGAGPGPSMWASYFAESFGIPLQYYSEAKVGAASPALAVCQAVSAIAQGRASTVVIATAAGGDVSRDEAVERMAFMGNEFEYLWGTSRVADYALIARRHMHEYGTTSAQLAEVAVACRKHATLNPNSVMGPRGLISVEDVLNSRLIADPLHLLDCCLINNGGGAVVVTTAERARSLAKPPVYILGMGEGYTYEDRHYAPSLTSFGGVYSARRAFARAGVRHDDIDLAEISDHFTIDVIIELEDAGFCPKGEGGPFVEGGTLQLGGKLPTNTDGGFLSHSHGGGCGLYSIIEAVRQLRGEGGARQVPRARLALVQGTGGVMMAEYTAILGRE